jgi:hypothetical protein
LTGENPAPRQRRTRFRRGVGFAPAQFTDRLLLKGAMSEAQLI